jgi:DNA-binding response OmpR family regulator
MPRCSGLEILTALRDCGGEIPTVILMTGGMPRQAAGARTCLRKPIRPKELLAEIGAVLGGGPVR